MAQPGRIRVLAPRAQLQVPFPGWAAVILVLSAAGGVSNVESLLLFVPSRLRDVVLAQGDPEALRHTP